MENKCKCYHTQKKLRYTYNPITGSPIPHDIVAGVCWGTKETDECKCDGNRARCDFYPEVREKAMAEIGEDSLIVTYDCYSPDEPTLCVARKDGDKVRVLNTIQGDAAFGIYHYFTGGAELKSAREIPMKHHHTIVGECSGGERIRTSICPNCLGCIMTVEEEFPRFCAWCGQAIEWE